MIRTAFTEMAGIRYPIIGAPMFLVSFEELTVAVSEAGALGAFPAPNYLTIDELKAALSRIRRGTSKPVGVNLQLHDRFPWREQLAACLDAGVKFFSTAMGNPQLIINDVHANGGHVFASVISCEQAWKAADRGVDGLVAVGAGAGGHGGTLSNTVFVPYLKKHLGLPVIAAGGIATGAQMAAALSVGADAVQVGTRLIASPEARACMAYKEMILEAGPEDIIYTDRVTGSYVNWLKKSIEKYPAQLDSYVAVRWVDIWSAGQSVAQVNAIKPAGDIINEMVDEFRRTCRNLQHFIQQ